MEMSSELRPCSFELRDQQIFLFFLWSAKKGEERGKILTAKIH